MRFFYMPPKKKNLMGDEDADADDADQSDTFFVQALVCILGENDECIFYPELNSGWDEMHYIVISSH